MDPYGDYTIYMIDIFGSFEATLVAYLLGVLLVLTIGMEIGYLFFKLVESTHEERDELQGSTLSVTAEAATPSTTGDGNMEENA